ncbi:mCG147389 [Mus musculus]|nr:mCG147389 [Mus musculus]
MISCDLFQQFYLLYCLTQASGWSGVFFKCARFIVHSPGIGKDSAKEPGNLAV